MYSERLLSPHPYRTAENISQQPLLDVIDKLDIPARLALAENTGPAAAREALQAAVDETSIAVNRSLWYPISSRTKPDYVPDFSGSVPFESMAEAQVTNCYGYTMVLSECFERVGIPHYIGTASQHVFALVPVIHDDDKPSFYFADALTPEFNHDIQLDLSGGPIEETDQLIGQYGRAAFMLHADRFARQFMSGDFLQVAAKNDWLINGGGSETIQRINDMRDDRWASKLHQVTKLIMSVYPVETGRQMLAYYHQLLAETAADSPSLTQTLQNMHGLHPIIDVRNPHPDIAMLVDRFAKRQDFASAEMTIDGYLASFAVSQDPRVDSLRGDLLRKLARHTPAHLQPNYFLQAVEAYDAAARKSRYPENFAAKAQKATKLLGSLGIAEA